MKECDPCLTAFWVRKNRVSDRISIVRNVQREREREKESKGKAVHRGQ